MPPFTDLEG